MRKKQLWMNVGFEVIVEDQQGIITAVENMFLNGIEYVKYLFIQFPGIENPTRCFPFDVTPVKKQSYEPGTDY